MSTDAQFYQLAIWTSKVGQGDVVFDVRSGFGSESLRSVRARLQVSVYSDTTCATLVVPKFDSYILTPCDPEK